MTYIAKHYVRIAGRMHTPGEIFAAEIPESKLERLLSVGALEQAKEPVKPKEADVPHSEAEEPALEIAQDAPQAEEESNSEAEEIPAPEIDATEGLIAAQPGDAGAAKSASKPRKSGGRKRA